MSEEKNEKKSESRGAAIRESAIAIMVTLTVVVGLVVGLMYVIADYEKSREARKANREHECATACIPDDVAACPSEGKPVCATSDPWPTTYVAGNRPKNYWERSRQCEEDCKNPEKCEAICHQHEKEKGGK